MDGDISHIADGMALEVCAIPCGLMFALGTALSGALRRPFHLVFWLALLSGIMNGTLLWETICVFHYSWHSVLPGLALVITLIGLWLASIGGRSKKGGVGRVDGLEE